MNETSIVRCKCGTSHYETGGCHSGWYYEGRLHIDSEKFCPNCGTRLNADGTTTEMVPKSALEVTCATLRAWMLTGGRNRSVEDLMATHLAVAEPQKWPTIPDCGTCTRECTDAGKPHNQRSLPQEECQYTQEQAQQQPR